MRTSLAGLRARVDRLAVRIDKSGEGCDVCRQDEKRTRIVWQAVPADAPLTNSCSACGRSYELTYMTFSWLPAQPKPDSVCP
jgi:hypothetical protein